MYLSHLIRCPCRPAYLAGLHFNEFPCKHKLGALVSHYFSAGRQRQAALGEEDYFSHTESDMLPNLRLNLISQLRLVRGHFWFGDNHQKIGADTRLANGDGDNPSGPDTRNVLQNGLDICGIVVGATDLHDVLQGPSIGRPSL